MIITIWEYQGEYMKSYNGISRGVAAGVAFAAGLTLSGNARADFVIPDDLIVQGSQCVGLDCVDGQSFGFSTLILKENNLRIRFEDTSVGAFPANKWELVANDSASGGANFFAIFDATAAKSLLKVTAGARENALFVSSTSNLGLGTGDPLLALHVLKSDTPAIRLEQDNAGGFTAQTWDIGANEANFFVRDLTGGSRLPFRIRPGAPTSSIDIGVTGFVGIGTASPAANLHVSSATNPTIQIQTTTGSLGNWSVSVPAANGIFTVRDVVANTQPFKVTPGAPTNSFVIKANGGLQLAGLPNCKKGLKTNSTGVVSCVGGDGDVRADSESASIAPGVTRASYSASHPVSGGGATGSSSANAAETEDTASGCDDADIAGSWSMFGTNIEDAGTNSVLWCDVQFSKAGKVAKFSIDGVCRSHATNAALPQNFTVSGERSISVTPACKFSGSFTIKQGNKAPVTATILEGRIEGEAGPKSRAIGLTRWPHGKAFALQSFTMQR
jgi:hypothetical protein